MSLKFTIEKNPNQQTHINEHIGENEIFGLLDTIETEIIKSPQAEETDHPDENPSPRKEHIKFLMGACDNKFTFKQVEVLYNAIADKLYNGIAPNDSVADYNYLRDRYKYMEMQAEQGNVKNRFGYVKSLIGEEI